jgi:uncharacterized protein YegP (UPF0339 family)
MIPPADAGGTDLIAKQEKENHLTYHYVKDKQGEWRWHLKAANGRILADSGEGYNSEQECLEDIKQVKASADAPVRKD